MTHYIRPDYTKYTNSELIERITQLEELQNISFMVHPKYRLTTFEESLLGLLLAASPMVLSKEHAYTVLYGMYLDPPEIKIFDVFICKLRNKLRPFGIVITTVWGRGWILSTEDRARVAAMQVIPIQEVAA